MVYKLEPGCNSRPCQDTEVCMTTGYQARPFMCTQVDAGIRCELGWEGFGKKCYFFGSVYLFIADAIEFCKNNGSQLVQVDTVEEGRFLQSRMTTLCKSNKSNYWSDLIEVSRGHYRWRTTNDTYDPKVIQWMDGKPDGIETCTLFSKIGGYLLDDIPCGDDLDDGEAYKAHALCEK